jgi:ribosomal protein S18 acetylase RimI-like enzyme
VAPDAPGRSGSLSACAVGTVERRLAGPANPTGRAGYLFNVSTDPAYRRRGHARACVAALVDWFRTAGVGRVDLQTTDEAQALYASLGFRRRDEPVMRLRTTRASEY